MDHVVARARGEISTVQKLGRWKTISMVEDGRFVNAPVLDLKGNRLVQKVRTVFVKDTSPEKMVKNLRRGDRLHVFGLPRFDLSIVDWGVKYFKDAPEILNHNLPYEIVVVGVYKNLK